MRLLLLWLPLEAAAPEPLWSGRLVDLPDVHVGLRPAADALVDGAGVGLTLQITVRTPW